MERSEELYLCIARNMCFIEFLSYNNNNDIAFYKELPEYSRCRNIFQFSPYFTGMRIFFQKEVVYYYWHVPFLDHSITLLPISPRNICHYQT